jgi:hypothetical protein
LVEDVRYGSNEGVVEWMSPRNIKDGYRTKKKGIKSWNSYALLPASIESTCDVIDVQAQLGSEYSFIDGSCVKQTTFRNNRNGVEHDVDSTRKTIWKGFPKLLTLDEELGWLLGLYAAEGSCTHKQVTISLGSGTTDEALAARFVEGMKIKFGIEFKAYPRPEKSLLELVAHHTALARLLGQL